MILRIISFFEEQFSELEKGAEPSAHQVQLASAALMFEVVRADGATKDDEINTLKQLLQEQFELPAAELDELIELAEQQSNEATSLYQFTRLINDHFDAGQKLQVIASMWKIAVADGNIDRFEEHIIRRVAELVYIPHKDFIRSKLEATGKA